MVLLILAGLVLLQQGAGWFVDGSSGLARRFKASELAIGLTIVAAGTSLPELATSLIAAVKKNHDIALGNIVGSNIFNILFILSLSAFIQPLQFSPSFNMDLYFLAGGTILLFLTMYSGKRQKIDRWEAVVLPGAYAVYMYFLFVRQS